MTDCFHVTGVASVVDYDMRPRIPKTELLNQHTMYEFLTILWWYCVKYSLGQEEMQALWRKSSSPVPTIKNLLKKNYSSAQLHHTVHLESYI